MAYLDSSAVVVLSPVPCVQVTVFDSADDWGGVGTPPVTAGVVRVNADGTREQVRSGSVTDSDGRSVWADYECPQQEQVTYQPLVSFTAGAVASSDPVMVPDVGAWLIDPVNPAGSVPIVVQDGGFGGWTRAATVSSTPIAGSYLPYVVESSVRQAPTGDLSVWVLDTDSHDALLAVLATPGAKLFSWPRSCWKGYGQVRWAFVDTVADTPGPAPASVKWGAQLSLIPSARPAVVVGSAAKSWEDLRGSTWESLRGSSWDAL